MLNFDLRIAHYSSEFRLAEFCRYLLRRFGLSSLFKNIVHRDPPGRQEPHPGLEGPGRHRAVPRLPPGARAALSPRHTSGAPRPTHPRARMDGPPLTDSRCACAQDLAYSRKFLPSLLKGNVAAPETKLTAEQELEQIRDTARANGARSRSGHLNPQRPSEHRIPLSVSWTSGHVSRGITS